MNYKGEVPENGVLRNFDLELARLTLQAVRGLPGELAQNTLQEGRKHPLVVVWTKGGQPTTSE